LSSLLDTQPEISNTIKENFLVVLIDVDKGHNADVVQKYGNPTQYGLPVLVVLDKNGKRLATQDTGKLEQGSGYDLAKVKAFLEQWKPAKIKQ
jgi:hypothetical protein